MKPVERALDISKRIIEADKLIEGWAAELSRARKERGALVEELEGLLADEQSTLSDRVLDVMRASGTAMTPEEVAAELDANIGSIRSILSRLKSDGKLVYPARGMYQHPASAVTPGLLIEEIKVPARRSLEILAGGDGASDDDAF